MGCSNDDNTPPAPKAEPYKFDESVIKDPASTIACAEIDKVTYLDDHLAFYESSGYFAGKAKEARSSGDTQEADRLDQEADRVRKACPYSKSDIILSDYPRGSDNILMGYDGGLRINIRGFEVTIARGEDIESVVLALDYSNGTGIKPTETKRYDLTLVSGKYKPADIEADFQVTNRGSIEMRLMIMINVAGSSRLLGELALITVKGSASFQRISQTGGKPSMIKRNENLILN